MNMNNRVKNIVLVGLFAALIFVSILFLNFPNPAGGIIHFGDSLIFTAAVLLPFPYALFAAAIGPGILNIVRVPHFFFFTIMIKPVLALCFTSKGSTILGQKRNIIAPFIAAVLNIVLYFFATMFLFAFGIIEAGEMGAWAAGIAGLPGDFIQGAGSIMVFFVIAGALDKLKVKEQLFPER